MMAKAKKAGSFDNLEVGEVFESHDGKRFRKNGVKRRWFKPTTNATNINTGEDVWFDDSFIYLLILNEYNQYDYDYERLDATPLIIEPEVVVPEVTHVSPAIEEAHSYHHHVTPEPAHQDNGHSYGHSAHTYDAPSHHDHSSHSHSYDHSSSHDHSSSYDSGSSCDSGGGCGGD
jgi:hypothetical protein